MAVAVLLCLANTTSCAGIRPCPARGGPTWHEVATDHFVLATNVSHDNLTAALPALENLRWSILEAMFPGETDRAGRVNVWILSEDEWVDRFVPLIRGFFARIPPFGAAIIMQSDDVFGERHIKHELAHYVMDAYIRNQPRWFSEGMAQYLETINYHQVDGRDAIVTVGEWDTSRPSTGLNLIPTNEMLAATQNPATENHEREHRFYTTAWLMVEYLINARRTEFARFLRDLRAGVEADASFSEHFPDLTGDKFDSALRQYVESGKYIIQKFHVTPPEYKIATRVLPEVELHTIRAKIDAATPPAYSAEPSARVVRVTANLDEAKAADPLYLDALALDADVLHRPCSPDIARRLVAANPEKWLAWHVAAAAFSALPGYSTEAVEARNKAVRLLLRRAGSQPPQ